MFVLQLKEGGKKSQLSGFNDPNISTSHVIIDLVDCLKPGSIKYDHVKDGDTDEVSLRVGSMLHHSDPPYIIEHAIYLNILHDESELN